jgi:hypothetical protein
MASSTMWLFWQPLGIGFTLTMRTTPRRWCRNLGPPVPRDLIFPGYLNFASEIGITSTPVIELDGSGGGILYVVSKTFSVGQGQQTCRYEIHALNLLTGQTRMQPTGRAVIEASVLNSAGRRINFDARIHLNRPGLLLLDGVIYLAFGSHADEGEFYGWVMAYDARTLKQLTVYNTAPDWGEGGIWQSGTGLAGDRDGYVYAVVGNGEKPSENLKKAIAVPEVIAAPVYGNAILKLKLDTQDNVQTLKVCDWFTASNTMDLNEHDNDFIGGPVLFDVPRGSGPARQLILGAGKDGKFYRADCQELGKYMPYVNTAILQEAQICAFHIHGAPIVWKADGGQIVAFVWSEKDQLKAFAYDGMKFDATKPLSTSVYGFPQDELRMPGGMLSLSWDGKHNESAIVWASHPTDDDAMNKTVDGTLRAFDARDLNRELWNSDMDAEGSDRVGSFAKFCPPVVANGKVYVATFSRELAVYGLFTSVGKPQRSDDIGIFKLRSVGKDVQQFGSYSCSRYSLRVTGHGIGADQDSFLFAYVDRDSDHESMIAITTRIDGINAFQYPAARVGVMIRKFTQEGDPTTHRFAALIVTNEKQALFLHRDLEGAVVQQDGPTDVVLPCFLRITARKNSELRGILEFNAEVSQDGTSWGTLNARTRIQMDGRLLIGLIATAQIGGNAEANILDAHVSFSKIEIAPAISDVTVE